MIKSKESKKTILFWGDIFCFYMSLWAALFLRYLEPITLKTFKENLLPFSAVYILWAIIFYIAGFYDIESKISWSIVSIAKTLIIGGVLAIIIFYFFPFLGITPKRILIFNIAIASVFVWAWRNIFFSIATEIDKIKISILGESKEKNSLIKYIRQKPYLGYEFTNKLEEANIILAPAEIKDNPEIVNTLYQMVLSGKTIFSFENFYESLTGKVPISMIDEKWFLENLTEINKQMMEKIKRFVDIFLASLFFIFLILIYLPVAIAIKLNSPGPVLYRQKRVGKNGRIFELIKFRSMTDEPESEREKWKKPNAKNRRITSVGNFLRKTRIDELPQLWNILKGDISFIGPRPERPEIVEELKKIVPHYSMRHIIKPGLTGWSQIHFSDASAEDAMEKLQYDLFYIKNRSALLDTAIFLKTIMVALQTSGK